MNFTDKFTFLIKNFSSNVAIVSGMLIMIYIVTFKMDDDERARR